MSTTEIIRNVGRLLSQLDAAIQDLDLPLAVSLLKVTREMIDQAEQRRYGLVGAAKKGPSLLCDSQLLVTDEDVEKFFPGLTKSASHQYVIDGVKYDHIPVYKGEPYFLGDGGTNPNFDYAGFKHHHRSAAPATAGTQESSGAAGRRRPPRRQHTRRRQ